MAICIFFEMVLLGTTLAFTFIKVEEAWNAITRIVLASILLVMCFAAIGIMPTLGNVLFQLYCISVSGLVLGVSIAQLTGALVPVTVKSRPFDFHMPDGSMIPRIEE